MKLSHAQQVVLTECLARTQQHAASEPPLAWQKSEFQTWNNETEFGPIYSCARWFGSVSAAERMRYSRAVRAIAHLELVEVTRFDAHYTRTVVHLKLTDTGEQVARQLLNSEELS